MTCAIYIRVSTEKQREKFSLPSQEKILIEYAKSKGWDYVFYNEGAGSGETLENRPQMMKLLEDAKAKKFGVCLVIELERLSRDEDLFDWLTIKKTFRDNNIKIATPNQSYDLRDDEDDFLSDLFGALAKREKKKLLKRMKRGALEAVTKGVYIGNHLRLGYKYDKETKKLLIVPEEAEIIKLIYNLCNENNMGTVTIAEYLNSKGIPTVLEFAQRKGILKKDSRMKLGKWTGGTVWRILTNSIYYGVYNYNKAEHKNKKRIGKRPSSEWIKQIVEPIITFDEFQRAQENIANRAKWSNRNTKIDYLLSGLIYCAECESKLQGATFKAYEKKDVNGNPVRTKRGYLLKRWRTVSYYKCYGRVKKGCNLPYLKLENIEKKVWQVIEFLVKQPLKVLDKTISIKRKELQEAKETLPDRIKVLEQELERVNRAEDRLLDAFSMADLSQEDLKKQMPKIKLRKSRIQGELESLKIQIAGNELKETKLANIAAVKGDIDKLTTKERREFIRDALDKVIVYKNGDTDIITILSSPKGEHDEQSNLLLSESRQGGICHPW
jgi:site-specific DNA recombinase